VSTDPLDIGLSALEAYGLGVDVAANDLANAGTAGFQGQNVEFQDIFAGAVAARISTNPAPGGFEPTGSGLLVGSFLESSNVDMAGEVIKMTASQKAYEANAKSVRTSDQMLNVGVNLDDEGRTA
jgi:flagellar hook protein FlgE